MILLVSDNLEHLIIPIFSWINIKEVWRQILSHFMYWITTCLEIFLQLLIWIWLLRFHYALVKFVILQDGFLGVNKSLHFDHTAIRIYSNILSSIKNLNFILLNYCFSVSFKLGISTFCLLTSFRVCNARWIVVREHFEVFICLADQRANVIVLIDTFLLLIHDLLKFIFLVEKVLVLVDIVADLES